MVDSDLELNLGLGKMFNFKSLLKGMFLPNTKTSYLGMFLPNTKTSYLQK